MGYYDEFTCHATLTGCYQCNPYARRMWDTRDGGIGEGGMGGVGEHIHDMCCTWWLS